MFNVTFNQSAKNGMFWSACLAAVVFALLTLWWGHSGWFVPLVKIIISLSLGVLVFVLGLKITPVEHRSVLLAFKKRKRCGPEGKGFIEGWNWSPYLQVFGIGSYIDVDMREQRTPLQPTGAPPAGMPAGVLEYTKGAQKTLVGFNTDLFWSWDDPYLMLEIKDATGELVGLATQALRHRAIQYEGTSVVEEDKNKFSTDLREYIRWLLQENREHPGRDSKLTDRVVNVRLAVLRGTALPAKQNEAIVDAAAALSRRESDLRDAETLAQGIEKLKGGDVDSRSAMAATLVGLGREGATFTHISVPSDVASAVAAVGGGVKDLADKVVPKLTGGTTGKKRGKK